MLSKTDKAYLSVARYFATKSTARNTHGCVVVKGGRVLATGWNKNRNHPTIVSPEHIKTDCSYHAEEVAIREAGEKAKGAVIYIARVNKNGMRGLSRPCDACYEEITNAGIHKIVYTS